MKTKKQKNKLKQLKSKLIETKEMSLIKKERKSRKEEIKLVVKQNKMAKGKKNISNKEGNIIDIKNLKKTYASKGAYLYEALKNVSFSIKKGDFVVILGTSGSGKTTLLNLMSGLDRPTSGEIIIGGTNISALTNRELTTFRRNKIGFIFQTYNLLLELNAKDNAEIGRQLQMDGNKRMDIDELFERVGLGDRKKSSITQLSGGQSQRVSIIRALSKNPDLIFADEPTGALDSKTSKKIIELFKEINKKYNTTTVIVTHDEAISKEANIIINVKDGKVDVQTQ